MSTIAEFNQHMSDIMNLGTTIESPVDFLSIETRKAFRFFERNHNFLYMESFTSFQVPGPPLNLNAIVLDPFVKRIKMLRQVIDDGTFVYFDNIHPADTDRKDPHGLATPTFGWMNGQQGSTLPQFPAFTFVLPNTETLDCEMIEVLMSDWDNIADTETPWLLQWGEDVMTYQVMKQIALMPIVRDAQLATDIEPLRAEALSTLLALDDEIRASITSNEMRYGRNI